MTRRSGQSASRAPRGAATPFSSAPPPAPSAAAGPARAFEAAALVAVLAAAAFVFRGGLSYFFSGDDFAWLAQARGLAPEPDNLQRWLSTRLFWRIGRLAFDLDPLPYHAASLAAHLASTAALYALLRRRAGAAASAAGAALFATHAAHFDAVYWASAIGDPLALAFALAALALLDGGGAGRAWAIPAFAAGLLCKESVIALPLAGLVMRAAGGAGVRGALRDPVLVSMLAVAAAALGLYVGFDMLGLRSGASAAYAVSFGAHVWGNLLTYSGWSLNFLYATVRSFSDAIDPAVFGWGAALLALGLAGCALPALRRRGWIVGLALFAAGLLPVLPLERHTYHYYLGPALAGMAVCVAAGFEALAVRLRPGLPMAAALAVVALLGWNGASLVRKIEHHPFPIEGLRANTVVDRALIAERVIRDLRSAGIPAGANLRFWSPATRERAGLGPEAGPGYAERNVRAALYDGLAVRLFLPAVREVRFVTAFRPEPDSVWYAVYRADGSLRAAPAPALERVLAE